MVDIFQENHSSIFPIYSLFNCYIKPSNLVLNDDLPPYFPWPSYFYSHAQSFSYQEEIPEQVRNFAIDYASRNFKFLPYLCILGLNSDELKKLRKYGLTRYVRRIYSPSEFLSDDKVANVEICSNKPPSFALSVFRSLSMTTTIISQNTISQLRDTFNSVHGGLLPIKSLSLLKHSDNALPYDIQRGGYDIDQLHILAEMRLCQEAIYYILSLVKNGVENPTICKMLMEKISSSNNYICYILKVIDILIENVDTSDLACSVCTRKVLEGPNSHGVYLAFALTKEVCRDFEDMYDAILDANIIKSSERLELLKTAKSEINIFNK